MYNVSEQRMVVRTALHRAAVAALCGSMEGEQRRSAWIAEQARLLGEDGRGGSFVGSLGKIPRPRRSM